MQKDFLYIIFSHTDFSPKIQIFLVIYTDFVLVQSGWSAVLASVQRQVDFTLFLHLYTRLIPDKIIFF